MQMKRKLNEREQRLLQMLIKEKTKSMKEIAHLANENMQDNETAGELGADESGLSLVNLNKEIDCTLIRGLNEKLKNIQEAIDRLAKGNYGFCHKCGEAITEKRLEALPFARYCVQCQKQKESSQPNQSLAGRRMTSAFSSQQDNDQYE